MYERLLENFVGVTKSIWTWLRAFIFIRRQNKRFLSIASRFARSSFARAIFAPTAPPRRPPVRLSSTKIYGNKDSQRLKTFERNTHAILFRLETIEEDHASKPGQTPEIVLTWCKKRKKKKRAI